MRISKYGLERFEGENSGVLVYGHKGSGKSGLLAYLALQGHYSGMLVISITSGYHLT
jgi:polynucleotide 5'-kinase involved in rRNA processing